MSIGPDLVQAIEERGLLFDGGDKICQIMWSQSASQKREIGYGKNGIDFHRLCLEFR